MVAVVSVAAAGERDQAVALARHFSPRIDECGPCDVALDTNGLTALFGDARTLGEALRRSAADRGLRVRVAIASTCTAARFLVHHRAGLTVVAPGTEGQTLATLPVGILRVLQDAPDGHGLDVEAALATFHRWGIRTLGELAAIDPSGMHARLGEDGRRWQRLARGEDLRPLVPALPEERFEEVLDLEWPIEGLEPLSFVLGRLLEPLTARLERRDRGVAVLRVQLHLVTREVHERSLELPSAIRDARTLRTLALLDLESHPPAAAIDRVVVAAEPTPARVLQFSLLTRPLPAPDTVATLMARLQALMGADRSGSPVLPDSWVPGACAVGPFSPVDVVSAPDTRPRVPVVALRRFRHPVAVRVRTTSGCPVHVCVDRWGVSGGPVAMTAGPWRTSGGWWDTADAWDRDEWDVTLASGIGYRLFRERTSNGWFIDAVID